MYLPYFWTLISVFASKLLIGTAELCLSRQSLHIRRLNSHCCTKLELSCTSPLSQFCFAVFIALGRNTPCCDWHTWVNSSQSTWLTQLLKWQPNCSALTVFLWSTQPVFILLQKRPSLCSKDWKRYRKVIFANVPRKSNELTLVIDLGWLNTEPFFSDWHSQKEWIRSFYVDHFTLTKWADSGAVEFSHITLAVFFFFPEVIIPVEPLVTPAESCPPCVVSGLFPLALFLNIFAV